MIVDSKYNDKTHRHLKNNYRHYGLVGHKMYYHSFLLLLTPALVEFAGEKTKLVSPIQLDLHSTQMQQVALSSKSKTWKIL